ncbi:MAG: M1 family metallopeptidase [Bacteroidota bacterium]
MRILFLIQLICLSTFSFAQNYWQQEVNYKISVRLDDTLHRLVAYEEFEYINNSPDVLDKIYIHLWPNAYKNGTSALAKQQYDSGEKELTFGEEKNKGNIDSLDFKVNFIATKWEYDAQNPDIAIIHLASPLKPGEKTIISTPFTVKIPSGEISRLGHIGQSYQITQWYPKPAVYDKNGWNPIPYLNQGEFYSEFGSFDVTITLPKNYVVGATGDCQTPEELDFLNLKVSETKKKLGDYLLLKSKNGVSKGDFPPSDTEFKTIRYTQDRVHDFAWFADKRYAVSKGEVQLPQSKKMVTTWAMWVPNNSATWQYADEYLHDGVYYYSLWNGDYPYNNVTAVDGTISAGGGMEYPTITVIGNARTKSELEIVIVHEVGHNWFYGILGTNERVHGWMDEGMNTLNEMRYVATKYPKNKQLSEMVLGGKFHFNDLSHHDMGDLSHRLLAGFGLDQAIETHSAEFTGINYGVIMYQKTGLVFTYLKDYLGDKRFDEAMHSYYENWKFKHPDLQDFRKSMEEATGENLAFIFEDLVQTRKQIDYKIKRVKIKEDKTIVKVKSRGQIDGPIEVNLLTDSTVYASQWSKPGEKKSTLIFDSNRKPTTVAIDIDRSIPEMYRHNNNWRSKGFFHRAEPIKFEFLLGDNEQSKRSIFWTPMLGGNSYDQFMLGFALHNKGIPFNKFEYFIAPMYSFGRNMVSGTAEFAYNMFPWGTLKTNKIGLSVKSYKYYDSYSGNKSDGSYLVFSPFWSMKLPVNNKDRHFSHDVLFQGVAKFTFDHGTMRENYAGGFAQYNADLNYADHQLNVKVRNEFLSINIPNIYIKNTNMSRLNIEATYVFNYLRNKMERSMEFRAFFGTIYHLESQYPFLFTPYRYSLSGADGSQDLFFEEYYFSRRPQSFNAQIRNENMGGFRSTTNFGSSSSTMFTVNFFGQLPIPKFKWLGVFADYGMIPSSAGSYAHAINTGIGLRIGKIAGVYFPVWASNNIMNSFTGSNYWKQIRFTLRFNPINKPIKTSILPF